MLECLKMPEAKDSLDLPVEKQMTERRQELKAAETSLLQKKVWGKIRQLARFGVPAITLLSVLTSACSDAEQKISTPTPQVHQPVAAETATVIPSTETPLLTPKESPAPVETPTIKELPAANWQILTDPQIEGTISEYPFNRTVEQDLAIINAALTEVPKIGEVKIILTDSDRPSFNNEPEIPEIYISRKTFPDYMRAQLFHEAFHLWDPEANYQQLPKVLSEADLAKLKELREQILNDPAFKPNVPHMEQIFTGEKASVTWNFSKTYTNNQLAELVTINPDIFWLVQGPSVDNTRSHFLFEPFLQNSLDMIKTYAQEPGLAEYDSLKGFMAVNQPRLDALSEQDPIIAKALEILRTKQELFTFKNLLWTGGRLSNFQIGGKYTADWWNSLPYLVNGVLSEGIMTEDPQVTSLFGDQARQLRVDLENLKEASEMERFAELGNATLIYNVQTPFTLYLDKLKSIAASR